MKYSTNLIIKKVIAFPTSKINKRKVIEIKSTLTDESIFLVSHDVEPLKNI